jgi:Pentapeptide repeats (8 copies)
VTRELELRADCSRCAGLCCVAPTFSVSADFAIDKPAGVPCPNLGSDFGCTIHPRLRAAGFPGCTTYDCFGAGQHVTQGSFGGMDWQHAPEIAPQLFAAFAVMRQLHELLWHLRAALELPQAPALHPEIQHAFDRTLRLADLPPEELVDVDLDTHWPAVNDLLVRVSAVVRSHAPQPTGDYRGKDFIGADLRRHNLIGASLRGARLVGADLRGMDLTLTDLTGADLRGARVDGAQLIETLFLTEPQLASAIGNANTSVPTTLRRPTHWVG